MKGLETKESEAVAIKYLQGTGRGASIPWKVRVKPGDSGSCPGSWVGKPDDPDRP